MPSLFRFLTLRRASIVGVVYGAMFALSLRLPVIARNDGDECRRISYVKK